MKEMNRWLHLSLFVAVGVLLGFANGRYLVPGLIWIVPGILIAMMRSSSTRAASAGLIAASVIAGAVQWTGVVPLSLPISLSAAMSLSFALGLPFLADRLLYHRVPQMIGLLIFPLAQVSLELATSLILPFASFGAWAYTQTFAPPVIQIASLFGFWAVSFVIASIAPAIATIIGEAGRRRWSGFLVAGPLVIASLVFGIWRLEVVPVATSPVRLAGLASKPSDLTSIIAAKDGCGADGCAKARTDARDQVDRLLARTDGAAKGGKLDFVTWSEAAAPLFSEDEPAFVASAQRIAKKYQIYFAPAVFIVEPGRTPWRNEVILFDPQGNRVATHLKSRPVPGEISIDGPDRLELVPTPVGPVGLAICYDMDFQALARQASGARLMLVPGSDWQAIDPLHPNMVALRAVENGYAVLRPSRESASVAFDGFGREIGRTAWQGVDAPLVKATLHTRAPLTLYSRIGDVFAYVAAAVFIVISVVAILNGRRSPN